MFSPSLKGLKKKKQRWRRGSTWYLYSKSKTLFAAALSEWTMPESIVQQQTSVSGFVFVVFKGYQIENNNPYRLDSHLVYEEGACPLAKHSPDW